MVAYYEKMFGKLVSYAVVGSLGMKSLEAGLIWDQQIKELVFRFIGRDKKYGL